MDFTLASYCNLVRTLSDQVYSFLTFNEFLNKSPQKSIVLRHDVDTLPINSLRFARIQAEMGILGTYYHRAVRGSFDEGIIKEIFSLGHEVGYHYEDVNLAAKWLRARGREHRAEGSEQKEEELVKIAIESFAENLEKLRKIVPVKTICMHGSPMSKWDSRLLWKYYDYRDFGVVGEPYFDIDFNKVLYLTDTGRRWDGASFNIRDKAKDTTLRAQVSDPYESWKARPITGNHKLQTTNCKSFFIFHSTLDIIKAAQEGRLPDKIMMTFHPQRWSDKPVPWMKELVWQNVKNVGKWAIVKVNSE